MDQPTDLTDVDANFEALAKARPALASLSGIERGKALVKLLVDKGLIAKAATKARRSVPKRKRWPRTLKPGRPPA